MLLLLLFTTGPVLRQSQFRLASHLLCNASWVLPPPCCCVVVEETTAVAAVLHVVFLSQNKPSVAKSFCFSSTPLPIGVAPVATIHHNSCSGTTRILVVVPSKTNVVVVLLPARRRRRLCLFRRTTMIEDLPSTIDRCHGWPWTMMTMPEKSSWERCGCEEFPN